MSIHILLQHAKRKPYQAIPDMPKNTVFDKKKGYWIEAGSCLVSQTSAYGRMTTKKCDQETGEDQKGE